MVNFQTRAYLEDRQAPPDYWLRRLRNAIGVLNHAPTVETTVVNA